MKITRIDTYKERLEAKRAALLRSLEETRWSVPNQKDDSAAIQTLMQESRMLWIVESALQGIADGQYGKCLFCQRDIAAKLLETIPWSAYCNSCKKLAEAYVKRPHGTPSSL